MKRKKIDLLNKTLVFLIFLLVAFSFFISKFLGFDRLFSQKQTTAIKKEGNTDEREKGKDITCQISENLNNQEFYKQNKNQQTDCTFIACNLFEFF